MPNEQQIKAEWQAILEKDDRTSPEEYPDMALITFDEFRAALLAAEGAMAEAAHPQHGTVEWAAYQAWECLETANDWFAQREAGQTTTNAEEAIFSRVNYCVTALEAALSATPIADAPTKVVEPASDIVELHIIFSDEGGPSNLRFVEVETIDGKSVRAGTWIKRNDGLDVLALSVRRSDIAAPSPTGGGSV